MYPYYLLYGDPLSDPEFTEPPAGLFEEYARLDINGIWLQGVLYQLAAIPGMAQNDAAREKRLAALRRLADQAGDYGIGVYLYLNEPRCRPLAFFDDHPAWRGEIHPNGLWAGLCTSQPEVGNMCAGAMTFSQCSKFRALITVGKPHNCWSKSTRNKRQTVNFCRERDQRTWLVKSTGLAEGYSANPRQGR